MRKLIEFWRHEMNKPAPNATFFLTMILGFLALLISGFLIANIIWFFVTAPMGYLVLFPIGLGFLAKIAYDYYKWSH